jgi:hypothetical protein
MNPLILATAAAALLRSSENKACGTRGCKEDREVHDVYYVPNLLTKFKHFAEARLKITDERSDLEQKRLQTAIESSDYLSTKDVLEETLTQSELSRKEEKNVLNEVLNFVNSIKGVMGSEQKKPETCAELTCGPGAICELMKDGATCKCDEGFVGDGYVCKQPTAFTPKLLLPNDPAVQVGEIHVSEMKGKLLVVYHNLADEKGYALIGKVGPASVDWSDPVLVSTNTSAFSPQGVLIPEDKFVVSFRDANTQGAGIVATGTIKPGANGTLVPVMAGSFPFARMQSHQTSVVPLPGSRFAVFFSEHGADGLSFGSAMLGQVNAEGLAEKKGIFRFAESAVTRLTATFLTPESFALAYRAAADPTADPLTVLREEANVVYGKLAAKDLVFDPHPLALEPSKSEIWDRGLGLLTNNRFQYTYQSGTDEKTYVAVVEVDKMSHRMHVTSKQEVASGFTPFSRSIGLAYAPGTPRTFSFYDHNGIGKFTTCNLSPGGVMEDCVEKTWLSKKASCVSSLALGQSRVFFAFAGSDGIPYYQIAALSA